MNNLPLRWKLTLLILLVCTISLAAAFAGFFVYDAWRLHGVVAGRLETIKALLVERIVASMEQNPKAPKVLLQMLEHDSQIQAAAIFSDKNQLLAKYIRKGSEEFIPRPQRLQGFFATDTSVIYAPISTKQHSYGTLYLKANLGTEQKGRVGYLLRGGASILLVSSLFAFAAAYCVLRRFSGPITALARAATTVTRDHDYSVRVTDRSSAELAVLIEAFNAMLATIQDSTAQLQVAKASLEKANQTLEGKVHERTVELVHAAVAAQEANKAKSAFLAKMSHELRTPLNAIIGYGEILAEDATIEGNTAAGDDLNKILGAARHLLGLINDILDLSKIEAGRMDLHLETFDLATLIAEVSDTVGPLVEKRNNTLVVQCPETIGPMHADSTKVKQMLLNLLSNSSKFTDHGRITLTVGREKDDKGEWVLMAVIDNGIGMTPEQLGRLFQAFSQGDSSITSKYGGTGLGLVICRQFAYMMDGDINVTSEAGKGATFTIRLPANVKSRPLDTLRAAGETAPPLLKLSAAAGTAETVMKLRRLLIINDDESVHKDLAPLLEREGFKVASARNGRDGLRIASEILPDVIVLDNLMPGADGRTVLAEIGQIPVLAAVPVILLTMSGDRKTGFALAAAGIVTKPVQEDSLLPVLKKHEGPKGDVPRHALVVEDDPGERDVVVRVLKKAGWAAETAVNGQKAIESIAARPPSIILLDLLIAGMDGFEFLTHLRAKPEWKNIPVVVLAPMDIGHDVRDRLQGKAGNILQKGPYAREELFQQILESVRPFVSSRATHPPFPNR